MDRFRFLFIRSLERKTSKEEEEELNLLFKERTNGMTDEEIYDQLFDSDLADEWEGPPDSVNQKIINDIIETSKRKDRRKKMHWTGAAATFIVLLSAGFWLYPFKEHTEDIITFRGKDFVQLPDSSTVFLNENSELTYSFTNGIREVYLKGEGYFDVAHDAAKPFIVRTGKVSTRVLGTAFNIKAYPNENKVFITVTRGKVQIGNDERIYATLVPNELLSVNTDTDLFVKENVDAKHSIAWIDKFLILERVTLDEAVKLISHRFGTKITLANSALKKCPLSFKLFDNETLAEILGAIAVIANVEYSIQTNGEVVISGQGCE
jgi:transmembrane sensor